MRGVPLKIRRMEMGGAGPVQARPIGVYTDPGERTRLRQAVAASGELAAQFHFGPG
jgi:hypothetical protein